MTSHDDAMTSRENLTLAVSRGVEELWLTDGSGGSVQKASPPFLGLSLQIERHSHHSDVYEIT